MISPRMTKGDKPSLMGPIEAEVRLLQDRGTTHVRAA